MQQRDRLYVRAVRKRDNNAWRDYKGLRNFVVSKIRYEKDKYIKEIIVNNKNKQREMWKSLKTLLLDKNKCVPEDIQFGNVIIVNENVIARKFNEYFKNSIVDIVDSIPKYTSQDNVAMTYPILEEFIEFRKILKHELKGVVRNLKNVEGGQHGISNRVL